MYRYYEQLHRKSKNFVESVSVTDAKYATRSLTRTAANPTIRARTSESM